MRYAPLIEKTFEVIGVVGDEFTCRCPWHDDTGKPNLYVNGVKGLYLCMSCGAKGSLDKLGVLPPQSTQGIRDRLAKMKEKPVEQRYYPESWLKQFDVPTDYWTVQRGLSQATVDRFRLGYDPFSERVTIPLRDQQGRLLGVSKRSLDPDARPKYLEPKGYPKGRYLYGSWLLTDERKVALVEGLVDTHRCWEERVPALGLMGARLTNDQVKTLQRMGIQQVVLLMDNDNAGMKGTVGVYAALRGSGIQVRAGWYRPYWNVKDPDGLNGQRLRKMYHSAVGMADWADRAGL